MANLKYKTRGNSSPQGKPRVYFCCHPEDFNKYFESISDEILAKQDCTIWYIDKAVVRNEEFFADLKQVQLFVMPVTTNLLCSENEALDAEFKFAIENHIPVLPLMQEDGLEELFNKRCGDLQFLDKNNTDATAISYDEKLKKYLESVLIGDKLTEKIRAAFDAYVFLSYRKKDRRYAQELMRLIHKKEFCRDIAIWYDEFLTPGENFNDSIKEALQKSGLFVLAVTPNLVNETNYIMTTEYPMAKQEGKPILPAELVPTDREQLSEKYEGIPNPADAHNETELSDALLESIKEIAIKENDNSPEHNFFIGLAYLGGIDVEVDRDRALSLIKSAAESGLREAMEQLVIMYTNGIGVEINHYVALEWQQRLVKALTTEVFSSKKVVIDTLLYYLSAMIYLAAQYQNLQQPDPAVQQYKFIVRFCKKFRNSLKENAQLYSSACYNNMGLILGDEGLPYLQKALSLRLHLMKKFPEKVYPDLMGTYNNIGSLCGKLGLHKKAVKYLMAAIELYTSCHNKFNIDVTSVANIYNTLGNLYGDIGMVAASKKYLTKAVETYRKELYHANMEMKSDYANALKNLAILYIETGDSSAAEQLLLSAKKEYEKLVRADEYIYVSSLGSIYYELALCYRNLDSSKQAELNIDKAIQLAERAEIIGYKNTILFARMYQLRGELRSYYPLSYKDAINDMENALKFLKSEEETPEIALALLRLYNAYGSVHYRNNANVEAENMYLEALTLHRRFFHRDKSKRKDKGIILFNVAILYYYLYGETKMSRLALKKALRLFLYSGEWELHQQAMEFQQKSGLY